jgi:hypothetical protein
MGFEVFRFGILASMAACVAASTCRAQVVFDLGAVVGGGDGRGAQLPGNEGRDGVSTETGEFVTGMNFGHTYYVGYQPVAASPYIDGVFNLGGTQITSTGIAYELLPGDASGASFDHISNNRVVGDGPPIRLEGVPYSLGIGIHGGSGITFDLDAFREASGLDAFRFRAQFGTASGGDWRSRGYVVVSSDTLVLIDHVSPIMTSSEAPHEYLVPIPAHARFLTLMAGCGGDFITDDHAAFAAAVLEGCDTEFHSSPELVPFSGSAPLAWTALGIPATSSGARVSVVARGQIGTDTQYLDLKADGIQIASGLFGLGSGAPQCGGSASIATIDLDAALFSKLAADGAIAFVLEPSPGATSAGCPHPELSVHLEYELDPVDCNSNGQSDRCDILNGAADVDGDGQLDVCGRSCRADTNGDRVVDGKDLVAVIVQWGTCYATADCIGDVDGDGVVDGRDLTALLAAWGPCVSVPA